uniref:Ependymin-like 1 n=1 Tax=Lates calcarifer TaxID=8187 RepID=A0A4W6D7L0_LATCA
MQQYFTHLLYTASPALLSGALTVVSVCFKMFCEHNKAGPNHNDLTYTITTCKLTYIISLQSTQNEKLWTYSQYMYDALGQRIRLKEMGTYENKSFTYDALLLFREATMFEINNHDRTCKKKPLKVDFQPLEIPKTASLLGQAVIGSSSGPGQGLLVNTWIGDLPKKAGKFMSTVTEFGCIPVSNVYHTDQFGWVLTSFFNNVIGLLDPGQLIPPAFCKGAQLEAMDGEDPVNFYSLF